MTWPHLTIGPQPGPQTAFLETNADIALYGGAAGSGKSHALLLEPLRHFWNENFGCTIFRRNSTQFKKVGGMWSESEKLYSQLEARPREYVLEWDFPGGWLLKMDHLEYDRSVLDHHGSAITLIEFDELTEFSEYQFFYMFSRNRSMSGISGYIRATCNPDAESWVRRFIDWYIGEDGYPILERSGVLRWFVRLNDEIIWGESKEELETKYGVESMPTSFTFIPAKLSDNKILMEKDPKYLSKLLALPKVERERLLMGNWNIKANSGAYFQKQNFEIIDAIPSGWKRIVRFWDRASTKPNESNKDPDSTVGLKLYTYNGMWVVADVVRFQDSPRVVEEALRNTAIQDGFETITVLEQEPGASGVADVDNCVRLLAGFNVRVSKPMTDKITRALPVSAQCERGNVKLLKGKWNDAFLAELENFPPAKDRGHDDQVDALSGAFNESLVKPSLMDLL